MEFNRPCVSVIIPVYNGELYIKKCLESLKLQTLKNIEVICVNDGSTDLSKNIINEFVESDTRFRIINCEHKNASRARNTGLKIAKGDYLSFLDSDDYFEKNMLEIAYNKAIEYDVDICQFLIYEFDNNSKKTRPMKRSVCWKYIPKNNPFSINDIPNTILNYSMKWTWDKIYKNSFIKNNNLEFQEITVSNDSLFTSMAYILAKKIYLINLHLVYHRINYITSLSMNRSAHWDCSYRSMKELKHKLIELNLFDKVEQSYINWVLSVTFWNMSVIDDESRKKAYYLMKYKGFIEFNVYNHDKKYYYSKINYEKLNIIMNKSYIDFFHEYFSNESSIYKKIKYKYIEISDNFHCFGLKNRLKQIHFKIIK